MSVVIRLAKDFSPTPGGRFKAHGPFSGEEFRERLVKAVKNAVETNEQVEVRLDGVAGLPSSFLEEAFGGLVRELHLPFGRIEKALAVVADDKALTPYVTLAYKYMENAAGAAR